MNRSPPGSSTHGTFSARILAWVAMPSSRGSFRLRARTCISCITGGFFNCWVVRKAITVTKNNNNSLTAALFPPSTKKIETIILAWRFIKKEKNIFSELPWPSYWQGWEIFLATRSCSLFRVNENSWPFVNTFSRNLKTWELRVTQCQLSTLLLSWIAHWDLELKINSPFSSVPWKISQPITEDKHLL